MPKHQASSTLSKQVAQRIVQAKPDGYSLAKWAKIIGVKPQTMTNFSKGYSGLSVDTLAAIVQKTGLSAQWLLTGDDDLPMWEPKTGTPAQIQRATAEKVVADIRRFLTQLETTYGSEAPSENASES